MKPVRILAVLAVLLVIWSLAVLLPTQPDPQPSGDAREAPGAGADAGFPSGVEHGNPAQDSSRVLADGPSQEVRGGSVLVEVVWSDGEPAAGVEVYVSSDLAYATRLQDLSATTDALGCARFEGVLCGPVVVRSDRVGRVSAMVRRGEETRLRLQIRAGLDVFGRVEDPNGQPVARASIWLTRDGGGSWMSGRFVALADAAGEFRLRDVPADQSIGAVAPGFCPSDFADLELMDTSGPRVWIVLRMTAPGGRFVCHVVDHRGQPVQGAIVAVGEVDPRVRTLTEDPRSPRASTTDEQGACVMEGMAPGEVPVEVMAKGHPRWRGQVEIQVHETTEVHVTLPQGATVEGVVRARGGEPVTDVLVVALPNATPGNGSLGSANHTAFAHPSAISAADGRFTLRDVPPGDVHLLARSEGRGAGAGGARPWALSTIAAGPGEVVRWDPVIDKGFSIEGVLRYRSGGSLHGASIRLAKSAQRSHHAFSDANGCFAFVCLENEPYDLTVVVDGRLGEAVVKKGLLPGAGKIEILVEDRPAQAAVRGTVRGTVVDRGARLREGVRHWAILRGREVLTRVELVDGTICFQDVEAGEYSLSIHSGADCVHRTPSFTLGPAEQLVLQNMVTVPGSSLIVELDRRPGTLSREVDLRLVDTSTGIAYSRSRVLEDRAVFDNLIQGAYRVELEGRTTAILTNCASCCQDVLVEAASTATCAFVVRPAVLLRLELEFPSGHLAESIECRDDNGWSYVKRPLEPKEGIRRYSCWLSVPAGRLSIQVATNKGARASAEIVSMFGRTAEVVTMQLR